MFLSNAENHRPWQERWDHALMGTYGTPQRELVSGSGCTVIDSEGTQYLDLLSGIAVNALGHAHPAVVEAVTRQVSTLGHTSNIFAHPQVITLAENLKRILGPGAEEAKVFFSNSGAEANEAAFKIARATGRSRILAAQRGFHGRTMGSLALTGQPDKQQPFQPMPAGVEFYEYGNVEGLKALADEDTAAIFLEPIQGETGVIPAPEGFLRQVRQLCDELGILMVVDEVQAGMGRTGDWFAFQSASIMPDVITMAKGLGGGLPIGATVALPPAQLLTKGMHGTTFGGNPVVSAAANAVIATIESEGLLTHVKEMESIFRELEDHPRVGHVRGRGLMLGVVLTEELIADPLDYGLILNRPSADVLRLVPPLIIDADEARGAVATIKKMLDAG
ncbi:MAG TPA: acetylornithine transaminase [Candidatus Corynebacterium gallistercoris]|uniref:Acetylornithine aminotransferase n=1 Tax=Candidatus Corynebacterium gallistercoris TaxID=2838530 RepID=A0A9D1UQT2_9CORY|nr:acetylornithine transaminase [Candidatus Corynebacterium gallistercoris]